MGAPAVGAVVLVSFPFSDLSNAKRRPALILAEVGRGDWICAQITSKVYADPNAIALSDDDFSDGGLNRESYTRPGKLFTANDSLFQKIVGFVNADKMGECIGSSGAPISAIRIKRCTILVFTINS